MSVLNSIIQEVKKVVVGKDQMIIKLLMVILAKGHILIEDIPGVGKTTLALAFSKAINLDYKRIQFTPDVMPSDVIGYMSYNRQKNEFEYIKGVGMCNLLLADEINRTSSKTQSALLEMMEERKITVDGVTRNLPNPNIVIATQNPIGSAGTQLLPESQLDRFMIKMSMGYPDINGEIQMLKDRNGENPMNNVNAVATAEDIVKFQNAVDKVYKNDAIYDYIARIVKATRENPYIKLGVSPRGTVALVSLASSCAFLSGRNYVIPDDVIKVFPDIAQHRLLLSSQAKLSNLSSADILKRICVEVPAPRV